MPKEPALTYSLTFQDVLDILRLIDTGPFAELQIELADLKLKVARRPDVAGPATQPRPVLDGAAPSPTESAPTPAAPANVVATEGIEAPAHGVAVKPPMAGTFYSAPAPGAAPFVEAGTGVRAGDTVGIVEVMKLFTPVLAPCDGIVRTILVSNEAFVERDQTLMIIEPGTLGGNQVEEVTISG